MRMFQVLLEPDGRKPPTTFYQRLHRLGLRVRGDDSKSPIERRTSGSSLEETGVIFQEGAILCASESLARTIYNLAKEQGIANAMLGVVEFEDHVSLTNEDARIMSRIHAVHGRRGRPPSDEEKHDWTICCLEEIRSFEVSDTANVVNCPSCKGFRIKARPGPIVRVKRPTSGTNFEKWLRTRFIAGGFEVPIFDDNGADAPMSVVAQPAEQAGIDLIKGSSQFLVDVENIPDQLAFRVLDAVFASRVYFPAESRKRDRLAACTEAFANGANAAGVRLAEAPNSVDLFDAGALIPHVEIAKVWIHLRGTSNGNGH
jgi:hypothetical protein